MVACALEPWSPGARSDMDPPVGYGFPQTPALKTFLWRLVLHLGSQPAYPFSSTWWVPWTGCGCLWDQKNRDRSRGFGEIGEQKEESEPWKELRAQQLTRGYVSAWKKFNRNNRRVRFRAAAWMMEGDMVTCAGQTQNSHHHPSLVCSWIRPPPIPLESWGSSTWKWTLRCCNS